MVHFLIDLHKVANYLMIASPFKSVFSSCVVCLFVRFIFILLFVSSLSSCHEKATVAIYFGQILVRLEVVYSEFSDYFFLR